MLSETRLSTLETTVNKQEFSKRLREAISGRSGRQTHPWMVTELIRAYNDVLDERDGYKSALDKVFEDIEQGNLDMDINQ